MGGSLRSDCIKSYKEFFLFLPPVSSKNFFKLLGTGMNMRFFVIIVVVGKTLPHACIYVMSIMNIPTIPNRVATPVVLAPKMLPSTINKTATAHTKTPNAINTYRQPRIEISPLQPGLNQPNPKPRSILTVFQSTS